MQFLFSVIISMHTIFVIFVTPFHTNNVMLIHFSVFVSTLTVLIMDFKTLGQIVTCAMRAYHCVFTHNRMLNWRMV